MEKDQTADELLAFFADTMSGGPYSKKLKALYEANHIDEDLRIDFNDYFQLSAYKHVNLTKSCKAGVSFALLSSEDNVEVQDY